MDKLEEEFARAIEQWEHPSDPWESCHPASQDIYRDMGRVCAVIARKQVEELEALLRRVEPHLDAIICYASTMNEHEPNRIAHDVRAALHRKGVEPK